MADVTDLKAEVLTLRMENKELWGQVERLRNQLHDQQDTAQHNFVRNAREYKRVCDENAKLRELVKKLVIFAFARCANCDLLDASCALVPTQKCLLWNECESIARELGVEVDDG